MIVRTRYERDLELPVRLGDARLAAPNEGEITALIERHLAVAGQADIRHVSVEHVRYKPGTAIALTYSVEFTGGELRTVTYKAHVDAKLSARGMGGRWSDALAQEAFPLRPWALVEERGAALSTFPADPDLPGIVRVLDAKRTARWLDELGVCAPRVVRQRASQLLPRRYKFGRRAVFRLVAKLRGGDPPKAMREFGVRVHTGAAAAAIALRRQRFDELTEEPAWPVLLDHDERAGALLEDWLPGEPVARDDFSSSVDVARVLARLHSVPMGAGADEASPLQRKARVGELARLSLPLDGVERTVAIRPGLWIHGDLHPDQLLRGAGGPRLVDLDDVRPGAPEEDLASWTADRMTLGAALDFESAAHGIVEPYEALAGATVDAARLRALTSLELLQRASASVRRLERNAAERARACVHLARALQGGPS